MVAHQSVLLNEVIELLEVRQDGVYVDGTLGSGGHAEAILSSLGPTGRLIALDRDADAVERSKKRLSPFKDKCSLLQGNFSALDEHLAPLGVGSIDGIVLDLGLSSNQLDSSQRGFSFQADGPLDMRMDPTSGQTAADLLEHMGEAELAELLYRYGEETESRRIAKAIVAQRRAKPLSHTRELAELVVRVKRRSKSWRIHPATRTFQGLRIAVNRELEALQKGLEVAIQVLKVRGRLVVISFHSLEDRLTKRAFASHVGKWESLREGGQRWVGSEPKVRLLCRKPIQASVEEVQTNPRSRSAKLRGAERIE